MTHDNTSRVRIARFDGRKPIGRRWDFAYYRTLATEPAPRGDTLRHAGYLDSDFSLAPRGRWRWADEVAPSAIRHRGYYTVEGACSGDDTIRGLVVYLPHGRVIAGWSMGVGMATCVDTSTVYDCERDAALAADRLAEIAAEKEREYRASNLDDDFDATLYDYDGDLGALAADLGTIRDRLGA